MLQLQTYWRLRAAISETECPSLRVNVCVLILSYVRSPPISHHSIPAIRMHACHLAHPKIHPPTHHDTTPIITSPTSALSTTSSPPIPQIHSSPSISSLGPHIASAHPEGSSWHRQPSSRHCTCISPVCRQDHISMSACLPEVLIAAMGR